jgi:hypothetical protein
VVVACSACGAVLDAQDADHRLIAREAEQRRVEPAIPLGARGRLKGEPFEVLGFLVREITVDGDPYAWGEYLLGGPEGQVRWLTEYQGHWILARATTGLPEVGRDRAARYLDIRFRHFQTAEAQVRYVIGEFPWQVRVGERAWVSDFVAPPHILSCERTADETTWSIGEHVDGERLWKAFGLPGSPPVRVGVGVVQPSPLAPHLSRVLWLLAGFAAAAVLVHLAFVLLSQQRTVYEGRFVYRPGAPGAAVVTDSFVLEGRRSNVVIETRTDVSNAWVYFNFALIDEAGGRALDFGREVSYYFGRNGDGAWQEGAPEDRAWLPAVPAGRYYLLIEPETVGAGNPVTYTVRVRRDVPRPLYLWFVLGILVVPPAVLGYRQLRFEHQRWLESDHPMLGRGGRGGDDDED